VVNQEAMVRRGRPVLQDLPGNWGQLVNLDHKVKMVLQDPQGPLVLRVQRGLTVPLVLQGHLEWDYLEVQDPLGNLGLPDSQGPKGPQDLKDPQVLAVVRDH